MSSYREGVRDTARYITAFEHDPLPITPEPTHRSITNDEAEALLALSEGRRGFAERRNRTVRLAQYCGVVSLGERVLEVLPKVGESVAFADSRRVLLRLLRAADNYQAFRALPATQQLERMPLLEVLIAAFMDVVTILIRAGLLRQYRLHEEDMHVVRGRILLTRQFGVHFNRPDIIASQYDEHTADNIWNRAVKAALRAVRPWIVNGDLRRRWVELVAVLEDVADVRVSLRDIDRLVFDRQAVRYWSAIEWARWILATLSPSLRAGEESAPAFLFDMNVLFERAVANTLRRQLAETNPELVVETQSAGAHLAKMNGDAARRAYALRPDIIVRRDGAVQWITDTKWKRIERGRAGHALPSRGDMFQMHAYAAAYGADRLMLIYPDDGRPHRDTMFELPPAAHGRATVHVAFVDVQRDGLPISKIKIG